MKKYLAEAYGTGVLTLVGCATAMVGAPYFGNLGIALAFGVTYMAMYYSTLHISGAHLNPAVSIANAITGNIKWAIALRYILAQCLGAFIASVVLYILSAGNLGTDNISFLGQNDIKKGFTIPVALFAEALGVFVFVKTFLAVHDKKNTLEVAGIVLGLLYAVLHFTLMPITGASLNFARSFGPALLAGAEAFFIIWLFLSATMIGAVAAGLSHKWCAKLK